MKLSGDYVLMSFRSIVSPPPVWREFRFGLEMRALLRDQRFREPPEAAERRAVMLIPGFLTGDQSLRMLGSWLKRSGHRTRRAGMRLNVDCSEAAVGRLEQCLERFCEEQGEQAFVVGQSRGGTFARVLAVRRPDLIRGIVTLGSPHVAPLAVHPIVWVQGAALATLGSIGVPGVASHRCITGDCCEQFVHDLAGEFPSKVRFVAVYSRSDGIVDWRACLDPAARHVEVDSTHCGMSVHRDVFEVVDKALRPRLALRPQTTAVSSARAVA
jgi:pimeloyl-ACP methyl ester carboxylesterase